MKILITKDGERVTTVGGVQKAADYLGWTAKGGKMKELTDRRPPSTVKRVYSATSEELR